MCSRVLHFPESSNGSGGDPPTQVCQELKDGEMRGEKRRSNLHARHSQNTNEKQKSMQWNATVGRWKKFCQEFKIRLREQSSPECVPNIHTSLRVIFPGLPAQQIPPSPPSSTQLPLSSGLHPLLLHSEEGWNSTLTRRSKEAASAPSARRPPPRRKAHPQA